MKYNFDEIINRKGTNSVKYESGRIEEPKLPKDYLPLWIADMDFACPPDVIRAMHERLDERILGYSDILDPEYIQILGRWMKNQFEWNIPEKDLRISAGVVPAISNLIQILTNRLDKIMILTPSYAPFNSCIVNNERIPVLLPLKVEEGFYQIDFEKMEQEIKKENVKLLIFCSPHNPTGRIWSEQELRKVYELCEANDVQIICDEIHEDLIRAGETHIPLASLYPNSNRIFTCTAPSKTFNMAGNHMANIFIPDQEAKDQWDAAYYYNPNPLSIAATMAAYKYGKEWVEQLNSYIDNNFEYMKSYITEHMPDVEFIIPQGTYLAWINMSKLGMKDEEIKRRFVEIAGVFIEGKGMFVANDEQHIRVNLACPKSIVQEFLQRMEKAFSI